ncbi:MAG: hypothetical protein SGI84_07625 [Gemmatimonadota bacterium]|nr:hypothetical protein [Gemmatimonadota bacterium]
MTETTSLFEFAREQLVPLLTSHRFRLGALAYESGHAYAEYWRPGLRLRLVWEETEQSLWIDAAPESGANLIGRWQDIEWQLAGERLPLDRDVTEARVERLLGAVGRYLEGRSKK